MNTVTKTKLMSQYELAKILFRVKASDKLNPLNITTQNHIKITKY